MSFSKQLQQLSVTSIKETDHKKFFKTKSNSDLTLTCNDGKSLKVHKEVLVKTCADFFLSIDWKNNVGTVSEYDSKTINELLRFSYYGEVENMKKIAGDLLRAARSYKMPELEKICLDFIVSRSLHDIQIICFSKNLRGKQKTHALI